MKKIFMLLLFLTGFNIKIEGSPGRDKVEKRMDVVETEIKRIGELITKETEKLEKASENDKKRIKENIDNLNESIKPLLGELKKIKKRLRGFFPNNRSDNKREKTRRRIW